MLVGGRGDIGGEWKKTKTFWSIYWINKNEILDGNKCILVCSDCVRTITGKTNGLTVILKEHMPHMEWNHHLLQRNARASKKKNAKQSEKCFVWSSKIVSKLY